MRQKISIILSILLVLALAGGVYANVFPTSLNNWQSGDLITETWANALEAKIGADSSPTSTALDFIIKNILAPLGRIRSLPTTTGNLIVALSSTSGGWTFLPVGTNGKVLTASSSATAGISWETAVASGGPAGSTTTIAGLKPDTDIFFLLSGGGLTINTTAPATITLTNTGITSLTGGTGIFISSATGTPTITNIGVTSLIAGSNITVSSATGSVTISSTASGSGAEAGFRGSVATVTLTTSTLSVGIGTSSPGYRLSVEGDIFSTGTLRSSALTVPGTTTFNAISYRWPSADGGSGQILSTNGAGVFSWVNDSGGATSTASNQQRFTYFLTPGSASLPNSNFAGLNKYVANNVTYYSLDYDATTSEAAYWNFSLATDLGTINTSSLQIFWTASSTGVGSTTIWQVDYRCAADDDVFDAITTPNRLTVTTSDTLIAAGDVHASAVLNLTTSAFAKNKFCQFKVSRDVTDTINQDVRYLGAILSINDTITTGSGGSFTTTTINGLSSVNYTFVGAGGLSISTTAPGTVTFTQSGGAGTQSGWVGSATTVSLTTSTNMVGIGTSSPQFHLSVAGNIFATGSVTTTNLAVSGTSTLLGDIVLSLKNGFLKAGATGLVSTSSINLATDVTGNLPVTNLNSGTGATAGTFWRGDGTWGTPPFTPTTTISGLQPNNNVFNIATGTTGTDFNITTSSPTITFNLPSASAVNRGLLTAADWTTFNSKLSSAITSILGLTNSAITISGTANQINVATSAPGTVTLSTPQDIDTAANVTFKSLTVTESTTTNALVKTQLRIPSTTAPTLTATGTIVVDTSKNRFLFHDGTASRVLNPEICMQPSFSIENATTTEDIAMWQPLATSTITKFKGVNKTTGDTITVNMVWNQNRSLATSSASRLFTNYQVFNMTTSTVVLTSFASSTVSTDDTVRFVTSGASSTQFTFTVCYRENE